MHMNIYVSKSWKRQNLIGWRPFPVEGCAFEISQENDCVLNPGSDTSDVHCVWQSNDNFYNHNNTLASDLI